MVELFEQIILSHSLWGILAAYFAGILASFSPCIYPLIPVTLGIIGAYSLHSKRKGFVMSFIFVLGFALIYTTLGLISAALGIFLGKLIVNPVSYTVIGAFLFILGLAMLGIIKISLVTLPQQYTKIKSLFFAGMAAGLAAIPCIFPILGTILSLISMQKSILYGGTTLFSFSLGYGTILIVVGTCTSLISKLPKSDKWLIIIQRCIGWLLVVLGGYFLIKALYLL